MHGNHGGSEGPEVRWGRARIVGGGIRSRQGSMRGQKRRDNELYIGIVSNRGGGASDKENSREMTESERVGARERP